MRIMFLLLLCSLVSDAKNVLLNFQDVSDFYQGQIHNLGDFYDGGPGGNFGIKSVGGFVDPFVVGDALHFPLHGPGRLFVEGGFQGSVTFQYSFSGRLYPSHGIVLYHESKPIAYFQLSAADFSESSTFEFMGVADEIGFGLTPEGDFTGNAGDVVYRSIEFSDLHPPGPVYPTPAPPPPVTMRRSEPTQYKSVVPVPKRPGIR